MKICVQSDTAFCGAHIVLQILSYFRLRADISICLEKCESELLR